MGFNSEFKGLKVNIGGVSWKLFCHNSTNCTMCNKFMVGDKVYWMTDAAKKNWIHRRHNIAKIKGNKTFLRHLARNKNHLMVPDYVTYWTRWNRKIPQALKINFLLNETTRSCTPTNAIANWGRSAFCNWMNEEANIKLILMIFPGYFRSIKNHKLVKTRIFIILLIFF